MIYLLPVRSRQLITVNWIFCQVIKHRDQAIGKGSQPLTHRADCLVVGVCCWLTMYPQAGFELMIFLWQPPESGVKGVNPIAPCFVCNTRVRFVTVVPQHCEALRICCALSPVLCAKRNKHPSHTLTNHCLYHVFSCRSCFRGLKCQQLWKKS